MQQIQPQYYSDKALSARYEVSRATIWRWAANGQFPPPIKINGSTRWRERDLVQWEAKKSGGL